MPATGMECGPKCKSRKHAYELNAAITKGRLPEIQSYTKLCYNGAQLCDMYGRSALHVATARGKVDVLEWLLEEMQGDCTQKDMESGWTALHRAVFYGQLAAARLLVQFKSDLYTRDHEGLGPLDIAMKDRALIRNVPPAVYEMSNDRQEVYTWGDNANFTLGHSTEQRRQAPEVVDVFRKQQNAIKQIVMCNYHTVFLTTSGSVYTCGHGLGGRLGHQTEETCLVPKLVEVLKSEECVEVAAARNHTLVLTASGSVYSCGLNDSHQLGQQSVVEKCLVPKQVSNKGLKGKTVIGVDAGRFHSLIYTASSLFTCGLNAGQLGHPMGKGDRRITQMKQVSALNVKDVCIVSVKCSDAATVVYTKTGEIYVLHEYQCRKIASNRSDILHLCVTGGNLDHADSQILRENGGRELIISYLNTSGKVFIWHEKSPSLKRASWLIRRQLQVTDFVLTESGMAIVTDQGEVFVCSLTHKTPAPLKECSQHPSKESLEGEFGKMSLMELLSKEEVEEVQVRRVPNIHRAMYVTADRKGHNFAALQLPPNHCLTDVPCVKGSEMIECFSKLLDEVDEYDLIHDLILQVHDQRWPVHKYILVSRCANFPSLLVSCSTGNNDMTAPVLELSDIHPQILEQVLQYIYTDSCDLLTIGTEFVLLDDPEKIQQKCEDIFDMEMGDGDRVNGTINGKKSAYQVIQEQGKVRKGKGEKKRQQGPNERNPLKLLLDVARKWGIKGLVKRIGCVTYHKGKIQSAGKHLPKSVLKFDRNKLKDTKWELYDMTVKSEDGHMFQCHKSVLVARLEYFHSMLATGWMETTSETALSLAVPGDILEILLEFLYTDESQVVNSSQNVELLCNILVVADQMLVTRLKELCEAAIAVLVTMKNVGELLEFSTMYNADQLKATCQQFIILNLPAVLEGRYLDVLSDEVLDNLTQYYRQSIPNMSRRVITPYDEGPSREFLESLAAESMDISEHTQSGASFEMKKSKSRKKRHRTKSSADETDKGTERGPRKLSESEKGLDKRGSRRLSERQLSVSSDVSVKSDEDVEQTVQDLRIDCAGSTKDPNSQPGPVSPWDTAQSSSVPSSGTNHSRPGMSGKWSPQAASAQAMFQGANVNNSSSAGAVGPSLRDIMNEEEIRATSAKTDQRKSGKFSWKEVKKQQQSQQKTQHQRTEEKPRELNNNSISKCPWGTASQEVQSFRSLMVEDQETITIQKSKHSAQSQCKPSVKSQSAKLPVQSVSWGLPQSGKTAPVPTPKVQIPPPPSQRKPAWSLSSSSPQSPDSNVWHGSSAQSPTDNVCSFSEIIKHEQQKTDVLTKATNKPLYLIQMEEQAIQDLMQYYKASAAVDERITVERVSHESAVPVWNRERLQSS